MTHMNESWHTGLIDEIRATLGIRMRYTATLQSMLPVSYVSYVTSDVIRRTTTQHALTLSPSFSLSPSLSLSLARSHSLRTRVRTRARALSHSLSVFLFPFLSTPVL